MSNASIFAATMVPWIPLASSGSMVLVKFCDADSHCPHYGMREIVEAIYVHACINVTAVPTRVGAGGITVQCIY